MLGSTERVAVITRGGSYGSQVSFSSKSGPTEELRKGLVMVHRQKAFHGPCLAGQFSPQEKLPVYP